MKKSVIKKALIISMVSFFAFFGLLKGGPAFAAANLVQGGDFETGFGANWNIWEGAGITRQFDFYRSYDSMFGQGSYSAAIEASGTPVKKTDAGLVTSSANAFAVDSSQKYLLRYYAKASAPISVYAFLEDADTYQIITPIRENFIAQGWQEQDALFDLTSTGTSKALLVFAFGDMPDGTTLNLDNVALTDFNPVLTTTTVNGHIGDENEYLTFNNLSYLKPSDIEIELPYYDNLTSQVTTKRFHPKQIILNNAYFDFYSQTFPGLANVYVLGNLVGQFNYNVQAKVIDFIPSLIRADEDATVKVSGFDPAPNSSFVIVKAIGADGKTYDKWIAPHDFDSSLTYLTFKMPTGIISGSLYMQTAFLGTSGNNIQNKSNSLAYYVKPVIYGSEWSAKGFDQVGDKIKIHGKGISYYPIVNFYDGDKIIAKINAKVLDINDKEEVIEAPTPTNSNKLTITVTCGMEESDKTQMLSYLAKPKLTGIVSFNYDGKIAAAKPGDTITLTGSSIWNSSSTPTVTFQGLNGNISVNADDPGNNDTAIKITVPDGTQTGFVSVVLNGMESNTLPLEIIPKVLSVSPDPLIPGNSMTINALGVGKDVNLAQVIFNLTDQEKITIQPDSITHDGDTGIITLKAPLAISSDYSFLNLRYDNWLDNGKVVLDARPYIDDAFINLDDSILTIRGHGFSTKANENVIAYKYADADHTVINPKVQILGVFPTEDGQEIRIKILDNYQYGYVSVRVGDYVSNEVNFGPVFVRRIARRIEYVKSDNQVMGVLYIMGYNFGSSGGVKVGDTWAEVHYRSDFFIIAVVDKDHVYDNPVIVAK